MGRIMALIFCLACLCASAGALKNMFLFEAGDNVVIRSGYNYPYIYSEMKEVVSSKACGSASPWMTKSIFLPTTDTAGVATIRFGLSWNTTTDRTPTTSPLLSAVLVDPVDDVVYGVYQQRPSAGDSDDVVIFRVVTEDGTTGTTTSPDEVATLRMPVPFRICGPSPANAAVAYSAHLRKFYFALPQGILVEVGADDPSGEYKVYNDVFPSGVAVVSVIVDEETGTVLIIGNSPGPTVRVFPFEVPVDSLDDTSSSRSMAWRDVHDVEGVHATGAGTLMRPSDSPLGRWSLAVPVVFEAYEDESEKETGIMHMSTLGELLLRNSSTPTAPIKALAYTPALPQWVSLDVRQGGERVRHVKVGEPVMMRMKYLDPDDSSDVNVTVWTATLTEAYEEGSELAPLVSAGDVVADAMWMVESVPCMDTAKSGLLVCLSFHIPPEVPFKGSLVRLEASVLVTSTDGDREVRAPGLVFRVVAPPPPPPPPPPRETTTTTSQHVPTTTTTTTTTTGAASSTTSSSTTATTGGDSGTGPATTATSSTTSSSTASASTTTGGDSPGNKTTDSSSSSTSPGAGGEDVVDSAVVAEDASPNILSSPGGVAGMFGVVAVGMCAVAAMACMGKRKRDGSPTYSGKSPIAIEELSEEAELALMLRRHCPCSGCMPRQLQKGERYACHVCGSSLYSNVDTAASKVFRDHFEKITAKEFSQQRNCYAEVVDAEVLCRGPISPPRRAAFFAAIHSRGTVAAGRNVPLDADVHARFLAWRRAREHCLVSNVPVLDVGPYVGAVVTVLGRWAAADPSRIDSAVLHLLRTSPPTVRAAVASAWNHYSRGTSRAQEFRCLIAEAAGQCPCHYCTMSTPSLYWCVCCFDCADESRWNVERHVAVDHLKVHDDATGAPLTKRNFKSIHKKAHMALLGSSSPLIRAVSVPKAARRLSPPVMVPSSPDMSQSLSPPNSPSNDEVVPDLAPPSFKYAEPLSVDLLLKCFEDVHAMDVANYLDPTVRPLYDLCTFWSQSDPLALLSAVVSTSSWGATKTEEVVGLLLPSCSQDTLSYVESLYGEGVALMGLDTISSKEHSAHLDGERPAKRAKREPPTPRGGMGGDSSGGVELSEVTASAHSDFSAVASYTNMASMQTSSHPNIYHGGLMSAGGAAAPPVLMQPPSRRIADDNGVLCRTNSSSARTDTVPGSCDGASLHASPGPLVPSYDQHGRLASHGTLSDMLWDHGSNGRDHDLPSPRGVGDAAIPPLASSSSHPPPPLPPPPGGGPSYYGEDPYGHGGMVAYDSHALDAVGLSLFPLQDMEGDAGWQPME